MNLRLAIDSYIAVRYDVYIELRYIEVRYMLENI